MGRCFCLSLLLLLALTGYAADAINVSSAWARPTTAAQQVAGVYLDIVSQKDAKLIGVETPRAERAELHIMRVDAGTMRMRPLESIDLPAGKRVQLKPGDMHVMLFGLREPLVAGAKLPLILTVIDKTGAKQRVEVLAEVRSLRGADPHAHH
jgi:periplasmic copper chaperone A